MSTVPTFTNRRNAWRNVPVDDVGYVDSGELLKLHSNPLRALVRTMEKARYEGWRNYQGNWRRFLGLDTTHDKTVCDYGCGIGIEALQYARAGNDVVLADVVRENVRLAMRVLSLEGFSVGSFQITKAVPFNSLFGKFDVVHCAGVLHHIPDPERVVEAMAENMVDQGELRLMVYSDQAWRIACGTEPPEIVELDENFERFWQHWDAVGGYADWYDADRLADRFGRWFEVIDWQPLTEHGEYLGAILVRR